MIDNANKCRNKKILLYNHPITSQLNHKITFNGIVDLLKIVSRTLMCAHVRNKKSVTRSDECVEVCV